jgi:hypothetical protein
MSPGVQRLVGEYSPATARPHSNDVGDVASAILNKRFAKLQKYAFRPL